jgi:4-hydroxy-tetrahydrodipicolinate reductase
MGQALARAALESDAQRIVGAVASPSSAQLGRDLGAVAGMPSLGVVVGRELEPLLAGADVVVDFSQPEAAAGVLEACARARVPLLIGTTGLDAAVEPMIDRAARSIPVLLAANTSLGVTVLAALVRRAAQALPTTFDIEIFEAHHRDKKDAPSGTALALGRAVAQARGNSFEDVAVRPRASGARKPGQIGFAVQRGGDVVGEHAVTFAGPGERLVLAHSATDRAVFARGAWVAARWLVGKPQGRYAMADVLGF